MLNKARRRIEGEGILQYVEVSIRLRNAVERNSSPSLNGHAHDFLVRIQRLVPNLNHQAHGNISFFQFDHRLM